MPDVVRAEPVDLARAAQLSLDEAIALFDGLREARDGVALPAAALGKSTAAAGVAQAHDEVIESAGLAVERLIAVLEQDVDALYQTAFAYQLADQESAKEFGQTGPNFPV